MELHLAALADRFAVCRLDADASLPDWAVGELVAITRTAQELSIVCSESRVPDDVSAERDWRALKVTGPLSFELTGVIAALSQPLADAGLPIFVLSTFDTDYLLVRSATLVAATAALRAAGHQLDGPDGA